MFLRDKHIQVEDAQTPFETVARTVLVGYEQSRQTLPSVRSLKIARKNALGFEFVSCYPGATDLISQERERFDAFYLCMKRTSEMLDVNGIPHIYIKFRKYYRYYDSNVDVVVRNEHWGKSILLLEEAGYTGHVMFKEPDKIMFSKPNEPVSIHLHPGVTWNGVPYFKTEELWSNSFPSTEFHAREMNDSYDLLINLGHNVFENYEISLGDTLYFQRFLHAHPQETSRLEEIARQNGWLYGFKKIYAQVSNLVSAWDEAQQSKEIPGWLLRYPYPLSVPVLARAFTQRVANNLAKRYYRAAARELYAYPAFYALKKRHDIPLLNRI